MHAIKVVAISTSACTFLSSCNRKNQLELYNLQKYVISIQKQPGCKKGAALFKKYQCENVVKSMGWLRNGCDGIG